MPKGLRDHKVGAGGICSWSKSRRQKKKRGVSVRVLRGDLQRGDGFQAGLDALLLSAVPDAGVEAFLLSGRLALASDVVSSGLQPVDRSLPAAAALALAALGAWRRGGGDISAGGRRGVQHLEPSDRNDGEQTVGLLLGVKREVAEDVLVMRTGSTRQTGSQAASLILKRHIGSVSWSFNTARISSHVKIYYSCSNVRKTTLFSKKKNLRLHSENRYVHATAAQSNQHLRLQMK